MQWSFYPYCGNMCDGAVFVMEVRFSTEGNPDWIHALLKEVATPRTPSHSDVSAL